LIIPILTHSSFCVLNFMLPACRPNFAKFAHTSYKVERAKVELYAKRDGWAHPLYKQRCRPSEVRAFCSELTVVLDDAAVVRVIVFLRHLVTSFTLSSSPSYLNFLPYTDLQIICSMHTSDFFFAFHKSVACYRGSQFPNLTPRTLHH